MKLKIETLADAEDVSNGLSDKPCFKITSDEGLEGIVWGWYSQREALKRFTLELFGAWPQEIVSTEYRIANET